MTDTNVNLSSDELLDLKLSRRMARATRKLINGRRYYRRYYRIRGRGTPVHMLRVSEFVVVTIGPLTTAYGSIGSDDLL